MNPRPPTSVKRSKGKAAGLLVLGIVGILGCLVALYYLRIAFHRATYPHTVEDLALLEITSEIHPDDRVWESLKNWGEAVKNPMGKGIENESWTSETMQAFIAANQVILEEFRLWQADTERQFSLTPYDQMGNRRRLPGRDVEGILDEVMDGMPAITIARLAILFAIQGIIEIRQGDPERGVNWLSESFAITHFLLQNPSKDTLIAAQIAFYSSVVLVLRYVPEEIILENVGNWLPPDEAWEHGLRAAVWLDCLWYPQLLDGMLSGNYELKVPLTAKLLWQYHRADMRRLFGDFFHKVENQLTHGVFICPDLTSIKNSHSQKVNQRGTFYFEVVSGTWQRLIKRNAEVVAATHALRVRAISAFAMDQGLDVKNYRNPLTGQPYQICEDTGALVFSFPKSEMEKSFEAKFPSEESRMLRPFYELGLLCKSAE